MRVFFDFLGCRLNEAEQASWSRQFHKLGHQLVQAPEDADIITLNTCAVTTEAARKSRKFIRQLHRKNPQAKLVATGCYATLAEDKVRNSLEVDLVVPNTKKDKMVQQIVESFSDGEMPHQSTLPEAQSAFPLTRTRAFVKVQDGCSNRCSFCIVTVARGQERSRNIPEIVEELNHLHAIGYQEIVITGVHLGGYGRDLGKSLRNLIEAILQQTHIPRIRLGSLEPWELPEDFFQLWSNPRLCPHLHLPLQSGSNSVLRRMIRRCTVESYTDLVRRAKAQNPNFHISTDLIVGFPGETEDEFAQTLQTIERLPLGDMHLFRYSPREGTAAIRLRNHVPKKIAQQRHQKIRHLAQHKYRQFIASQTGKTCQVLWERDAQHDENGTLLWKGYTDNYLRVTTRSPLPLFNQIRYAKLLAANQDQTIDCEVIHSSFSEPNNSFG